MSAASDSTPAPHVLERLGAFYRELDERVCSHQPVCRNRGACCKFDTYGHRLFVTGLEMQWFLHHHGEELLQGPISGSSSRPVKHGLEGRAPPIAALPLLGAGSGAKCPFQQQGMCTARSGRPVGCRVFFCESEKDGWQSELSEWALGRLKQLHEEFEIPYSYTEWLTALECSRGHGAR